MKKVLLSILALGICAFALHAFAQTAPVVAVPQSWLTEILHWITIATGWNTLLTVFQKTSSKIAAPTSEQVLAAAKGVGAVAVQAAELAAAQAATAAVLTPQLSGLQQAAGATTAFLKVVGANT